MLDMLIETALTFKHFYTLIKTIMSIKKVTLQFLKCYMPICHVYTK